MPEVLTGVTEAAIPTWLVAVGADGRGRHTRSPRSRPRRPSSSTPPRSTGTVLELLAAEGAGVAIGDPIVVMARRRDAGDRRGSRRACDRRRRVRRPATNRRSPAAPQTSAASSLPYRRQPTDAEPARRAATTERRFVSPLVRRLARERGIDLTAIDGHRPERPDRAPRPRARWMRGTGPTRSRRGRSARAEPRRRHPRRRSSEFDDVPLTGCAARSPAASPRARRPCRTSTSWPTAGSTGC